MDIFRDGEVSTSLFTTLKAHYLQSLPTVGYPQQGEFPASTEASLLKTVSTVSASRFVISYLTIIQVLHSCSTVVRPLAIMPLRNTTRRIPRISPPVARAPTRPPPPAYRHVHGGIEQQVNEETGT